MHEAAPISEPVDPRSKAVEDGIRAARELIHLRYEIRSGEGGREPLPYHNEAHTAEVIRRVGEILDVLWESGEKISERDRQRALLAAAWHDVIQHSSERVDATRGRTIYTRFPGALPGDRADEHPGNEHYSIEDAKEWMDDYNIMHSDTIFTEEDKEAMEIIAVTVPQWDRKLGTMRQKHLNEQAPLIGWALAFADIGTPGMRGGEVFITEGDALFREERLHVLDDLDDPKRLTPLRKEMLRSEMLEWSKNQITYAEGRRAAFAEELEKMPAGAAAKEALQKKLFNKFDESIEAARQEYELRSKLPFEELAKRMGYDLPHYDAKDIFEE